MGEEKSAGIVLFRNISNKNEFLLLNYPQGHWDFIKGKVEQNETPHETALRETKEETGISNIEFIDGFEESIEYDFRFKNKDIHKKVIFFLAKTSEKKIKLSHEHNDYLWLGYNDALKKTTFKNAKNVLLKANEFKEMTGLNEGLSIKSTQVLTLFVTIVVVSILFWFLNKTKTGKSMRAYSDNEDLALLSGIDPKKVVMITWVIAAVLATIGGTLYGLDKSFKPFTYFNNMLPIFAAAIVGGIGNPFGAFLGGYVIAFSEILLTYAYKKFFVYILPESMEPNSLIQLLSTDYKFAVSFSILVIVLLFRPSGIFKGKVI